MNDDTLEEMARDILFKYFQDSVNPEHLLGCSKIIAESYRTLRSKTRKEDAEIAEKQEILTAEDGYLGIDEDDLLTIEGGKLMRYTIAKAILKKDEEEQKGVEDGKRKTD